MTIETNNRAVWLVSDQGGTAPKGMSLVVDKPPLYVYAREENTLKAPSKTEPGKDLTIVLEGYVMPRQRVSDQYRHLAPKPLIRELYRTYGPEFIRRVKGMFTLVIIDGETCHIYNDRSGIRKFFHYSAKGRNLFSSTLHTIADTFPLTLKPEHGALFGLMEHFTGGMTLFNEVVYSTPAAHCTIGTGSDSPDITAYWDSFQLVGLEPQVKAFDEFANRFRDIIENYLGYFKPKDITMTLTGGNDSRTILAALLNNGVSPRAFTFGNPESYDGVVAHRIVDEIGMDYTNYYVSGASAKWFGDMASQLVPMGDSLINIHRAHRLDAIEKETHTYPHTDMLFAGFMGGDYIKGIVYDDYITSKLARLWEFTDTDKRELATGLLNERYYRVENLDMDYIMSRLETQPYFNAPAKIEREFAYVFNVVGAAHDAQDTMVFSAYAPWVVNIFMDIDFLELLFGSPYSMMHKDNASKNQMKRMMQPALQCNVIDMLAPELSGIEFAKHYSPREFLGNKLLYAGKRLYRYRFSKRYPANFPYEEWFHPFVERGLAGEPQGVGEWFDMARVHRDLKTAEHQITEKYWHPYTNIINLDKISKNFLLARETREIH